MSSAPRFLIRHMTRADLPRVCEVELACFGERWTVGTFANELGNATSSYFVGELGGSIVAFMGYWLILDEGHITTVGVDPAFRRRGFAERMLMHLVDHAQGRGAKWLTLEVRVSNEGAQKLYEKYGFVSLGRRKNYYQDNQEDALIMWTEHLHQADQQARLAALREGQHPQGAQG